VLLGGTPQSFSYSTTSFDPSTTTAQEPVPAQVEFLQPLAQASSNSGSIVIEVARSMNADQQVSVRYATSNGTAAAGTIYVTPSGTLTFASGQFYSQIVVPILPGNSRNTGGTFSLSLLTASGASIGPVSTLQISISGSATDPIQAPTGTGGPISEPIGTTAPDEVDVEELFQNISNARIRQTRHAKGKLAGFQFTFSQPLDASSATSRANYAVLEYHHHGQRMASRSIPFRTSYDSSTDKVSLILIGNYRFPQGGGLILGSMLASAASGLPAGNKLFTILPDATGII
jgi:hypothetical protein